MSTVERVVGLSTAELHVRTARRQKNGKSILAAEKFDVKELGRRLHEQLFGILEIDECTAVAAAVQANIDYALATPTARHKLEAGRPLSGIPEFVGVLKRPNTKADTDEYIYFLLAEQVRDRVLEQLAEVGRSPGGGGNARFRAAHVIYALSTHGRRRGRDVTQDPQAIWIPRDARPHLGWTNARDFLKWLEAQYNDLEHRVLDQADGGRAGDNVWWRPSQPPPSTPNHVVKRHKKLRRRGIDAPFISPLEGYGDPLLDRSNLQQRERERIQAEIAKHQNEIERLRAEMDGRHTAPLLAPSIAGVPHEPFIRDKFLSAVRGAISGRSLGPGAAENIVAWVLWGLAGQDVVLTSQLGAAVADCLRRLDDIAYLRWVIVAKELRVAAVHKEAVGLVNVPSPRLRFHPDRGISQLPQSNPGWELGYE